ncbi:uncharacterized protein LOC141643256 [Silene latifolia]|uniref:uncharacterized protein LOC141643256 n=1 Tax=Silene latifolia TaxID=37657 RepID=UPI003D770FC3
MASFASLKSQVFDREDRKQHYQAHIRGLNAFDRHHKFLNDYVKYYGKERSLGEKRPLKTDQDTLREGYRFIRTEEDEMDTSWEQRLVKRYYDKLFKEYCIADMSKYKTGKIGLRWRIEKEVMSGKGQFICGNKHCDEREGLASFEVNFSYFEAGEHKQALVKLVVCEGCAEKLHYKRNKEQAEMRQKEEDNRSRELTGIEDDMGDEHKKSIDRKRTETGMEGEDSRGRRKRSSSKDTSDIEAERSKVQKKKEKRESRAGKGSEDEDEDSYDEYLVGMFP